MILTPIHSRRGGGRSDASPAVTELVERGEGQGDARFFYMNSRPNQNQEMI